MIKNLAAENFNCFSTIWEEGPSELADFSDAKEDDSLDNEDTLSERDTWNKSDFEELGEISDEEDTWSETEAAESEFETHNDVNYEEPGERKIFCRHFWHLNRNSTSIFNNATVYSSRTCFPKFICSILVVGLFTAGVLITGAYPHPDLSNQGPNYNNQRNSSNNEGNYLQTENEMIAAARLEAIQASNEALHAHLEQALAKIEKTYKRTKNFRNEFQDHLEQSKQCKHWRQPLPFSTRTFLSWSTKFQNMPLETDVGDAPQVCTLYPSQTYLSMMSKTNTTRTESWETKWCKSSNKIQNCQTRFPKNIECHQRSSRKTPSWPWTPKPWPHTCSSNITTEVKETLEWRISPPGENHSSKRRSENDDKSKSKDAKSESESESKNTERKSEKKDIITTITKSDTTKIKTLQHKVTAKVDHVKAIRRTRNGVRIQPKRPLDKKIKHLTLTKQIL